MNIDQRMFKSLQYSSDNLPQKKQKIEYVAKDV